MIRSRSTSFAPALAALLVLALLAAAPAPAAAQEERDPAAEARFRIGPLAFTPALKLTTIGVDTNVFNQWEDPKRDFTFQGGPSVDWWFRAGRARLRGTAAVEYLFFKTYANQRGLNPRADVVFELPLFRVVPYVGITAASSRDRPGYEIDARARHRELAYKGGLLFRFSTRTTLDVGFHRGGTRFDGDEVFLGSYLAEVLNRDTDIAKATFRYALTPLTTLVLDADMSRDRFVTASLRDASSLRIMPGVDFDAFALISGKARLGYRKLDMKSALVPDFAGFVGDLDLAHTLYGDTRFGVTFFRDIEYSYMQSRPYYVRTGFDATVTRRIIGGWDAVVRYGRHALDYRSLGGSETAFVPGVEPLVPVPGRKDRVEAVGGGFGYRFSSGARIGVDVDRYRRYSDDDSRAYSGLRGGATVSYGF